MEDLNLRLGESDSALEIIALQIAFLAVPLATLLSRYRNDYITWHGNQGDLDKRDLLTTTSLILANRKDFTEEAKRKFQAYTPMWRDEATADEAYEVSAAYRDMGTHFADHFLP